MLSRPAAALSLTWRRPDAPPTRRGAPPIHPSRSLPPLPFRLQRAYAASGGLDLAVSLLRRTRDPTAVFYTSAIHAHSSRGHRLAALALLADMLSDGILPTAHTMSASLPAYRGLAVRVRRRSSAMKVAEMDNDAGGILAAVMCALLVFAIFPLLWRRRSDAAAVNHLLPPQPLQMNLMMEAGQLASAINHVPSKLHGTVKTQADGSTSALSSRFQRRLCRFNQCTVGYKLP